MLHPSHFRGKSDATLEQYEHWPTKSWAHCRSMLYVVCFLFVRYGQKKVSLEKRTQKNSAHSCAYIPLLNDLGKKGLGVIKSVTIKNLFVHCIPLVKA